VKRSIPMILTMIVGVLTLLSYLLLGVFPWLSFVRSVFVQLAIIVAAVAMFLGSVNVLSVHLTQVFRRRPGGFYSFVLVASFIAVLVVSAIAGGAELTRQLAAGKLIQEGNRVVQEGVANPVMIGIYEYALIPIQSSLAALLPFLLAFAAYRTLRMRTAFGKAGAVAFLLSAILVLLGQAAMVFNWPVLGGLREWILRVGAMAGMRGILLGVALGITATALRVLIGAERPTSD